MKIKPPSAAALAEKASPEKKTDTRKQNIECPKDPFCPEGWEEISKRVSQSNASCLAAI